MVSISNVVEQDGVLTFQMDKTHVSLANALRRVILSEINTVVIRGFPHEQNNINIIKNTSRFNNEVLKHRLINIPIHIEDESIDLNKYIVVIKKQNTTDEMMYVTTKDFQVRLQDGTYIDNDTVHKIFPPNKITKDYILFARLRPHIGTQEGEEIDIEATLTRSNAMEDSAYNCVSTCSYVFTPDELQQTKAWSAKEKELKNTMEEDELLQAKSDFFAIDAKRIYKKDSFQFTVETIGVYKNDDIIKKACYVLQKKGAFYKAQIETKQIQIQDGDCVHKAYDIIIKEDNYTFGKLLEYALFDMYFNNKKLLSFVSYKKSHPHDDDAFIRIMFQDDNMDANNIYPLLLEAIQYNEVLLQDILNQL